jgi:hypothetical protein
MTALSQVAKLRDQMTKYSKVLGEPAPHLHNPGDEATVDRHFLGMQDNRPYDVERVDDDGEKIPSSPFDGDDDLSFQRHSRLRRQKPLLYWRREAPLGEQSPLVCDWSSWPSITVTFILAEFAT